MPLLKIMYSYLNCSSSINIFCSLRETGGLKIDFEIGIFDDVSNHCTVTLNVLAVHVTGDNRERCIFPILPVNVTRS